MTDETRILVIGPGPANTNEGAEIDAAATEALRVLGLYGVQAVWFGSTPASLSSDPTRAFRTYLEPRDVAALRAVVKREQPHALCPIFGGEGALDLALALVDDGTLGDVGVALLGVSAPAIRNVRDRGRFDAAMREAGLEPATRASLATDPEGTWVYVEIDLALDNGGYAMAGVHEHVESLGTVSPPPSLAEGDLRAVRKASRAAMRAIGLHHGIANLELAWRKSDGALRILAISPRFTRSAATSRIATGFPLALVATELMLGASLEEMGVAPPSRRGVIVKRSVFGVGEAASRGPTMEAALDGTTLALRSIPPPASGARLLVVGPGPTRIGQGTELAVAAVEILLAARAMGRDALVLDTSPEVCALVSSVGERVIVGPPTLERILALHGEAPLAGAIVMAAGDAAAELEAGLRANGVPVFGSSGQREYAALLETLGVAPGATGSEATAIDVEVLSDGEAALAVGALEHLEPVFVHGGDAAAITPPFGLRPDVVVRLEELAQKIAVGLGVVGVSSVCFAVEGDAISVLDVTPRASRTSVFFTRAIHLPILRLATELALGKKLAEQALSPALPRWTCARERVFPKPPMAGTDPVLGSAMRSIGEVMGIADTPARAYAKALRAMGVSLGRPTPDAPREVLLSVDAQDRTAAIEIARRLRAIHFDIATADRNHAGGLGEALAASRIPHRVVAPDDAARELADQRYAFAIVTARAEGDVAATRPLRAGAVTSRTTCFTTIALARLGCAALEESADTVRSLGEWYAEA